MDFVRCSWIGELVSSDHELKCTFLMTRRKVDRVVLNMQAWKYHPRSCLVREFLMTPRARLFLGVGGVGAELGVSGMFHRRLVYFCLPFMMVLPFLKTYAACFEKMVSQLSSVSCPTNTSVPVFRSL